MRSNRSLNRCLALLAAMGLVSLAGAATIEPADARSREQRREDLGQSRPGGGAPLLAVVALSEQRVTIYNAEGRMLRAPISSGTTGYETPAGVFSVVQKNEEHRSNLYEDGNMPFMQRLTWTGIALHAGALPGRPASHGCVRMPLAFAQQLFGLTSIGMRVVIVREDITPAEISHPALFQPGAARREASLAPSAGSSTAANLRWATAAPGSARQLELLRSDANAKAAEAEAAARQAAEARRAATRKAAEAAPATKNLRGAESNLARAEATLQAAERAVETAATPDALQKAPDGVAKAEEAKAKAAQRLTEARAQLEDAKAQAQAKETAATRAAEEANAAEEAREIAADASSEASVKTSPVSVFISRKTQRLYVRKAYLPQFESHVTIRNADKPLGTYVFTALNYPGGGTDARWNVVSMYKAAHEASPAGQAQGRRKGESREGRSVPEGGGADVAGAKAALDRIVIPPEVLERIQEVVLPGSSLVISDEGPSIETGKDTDFVVVMSGEPQGALKVRKREPLRLRDGDEDDYWFGGGGGSSNSRRRYRSWWD